MSATTRNKTRKRFVLIPKKDDDIKKGLPIFDYFKVTCQDKDAEITNFLKRLRDKVSDSYKDQVKQDSEFAKELRAAEEKVRALEENKQKLRLSIEEKNMDKKR